MNLKKSFLIGVIFAALGVFAWEAYWRNKGFTPGLDDSDDLWAIHRETVERATEDDVVIIGSSRAYFDLQLEAWQEITGRRPIQLSIEGSSPLYLFEDLVNNTNYTGKIVVGVTESLFFSTLFPKAPPNKKPLERIEYYEDRTYAQQLNNTLYRPIDKSFAFISEDFGTDGIKLEALLGKVRIGNRVPDPMPPFHKFSEVDKTRNLRMSARPTSDTAFAASIQKVWMFFSSLIEDQEFEKDATTSFFLKNLKKFRHRGGEVILIRCPSTGDLRDFENNKVPRSDYWDVLVEKTEVPAYYFEDYPELNGYECPEWSHLSGEDADDFTRSFVYLLIRDGVLSPDSEHQKITINQPNLE